MGIEPSRTSPACDADGQLAAVYTYQDGLVVTLIVGEDQVRFKANRSWTVDEDGVVVFEGIGKPA